MVRLPLRPEEENLLLKRAAAAGLHRVDLVRRDVLGPSPWAQARIWFRNEEIRDHTARAELLDARVTRRQELVAKLQPTASAPGVRLLIELLQEEIERDGLELEETRRRIISATKDRDHLQTTALALSPAIVLWPISPLVGLLLVAALGMTIYFARRHMRNRARAPKVRDIISTAQDRAIAAQAAIQERLDEVEQERSFDRVEKGFDAGAPKSRLHQVRPGISTDEALAQFWYDPRYLRDQILHFLSQPESEEKLRQFCEDSSFTLLDKQFTPERGAQGERAATKLRVLYLLVGTEEQLARIPDDVRADLLSARGRRLSREARLEEEEREEREQIPREPRPASRRRAPPGPRGLVLNGQDAPKEGDAQ